MRNDNTVLTIDEEQSEGLSLKDIYYIAKKHIIVIAIIIFVCTLAGFIVDRVTPPTYSSRGSMMVSYEGSGTSITTDYNFSNYITETYVEFIKENAVLDKVSEKVNIPVTTIKKQMDVSNKALLISVTYQSSDPDEAKTVANAIMDTAQEVADSVIIVDGNEKPVYHLLYDNLKVLTYAKKGTKKSHLTRDVGLGFAFGLVVAFLYVFLKERFDTRFKSAEEIEKTLGIPVLAGIPNYEFEDEKKVGNHHAR